MSPKRVSNNLMNLWIKLNSRMSRENSWSPSCSVPIPIPEIEILSQIPGQRVIYPCWLIDYNDSVESKPQSTELHNHSNNNNNKGNETPPQTGVIKSEHKQFIVPPLSPGMIIIVHRQHQSLSLSVLLLRPRTFPVGLSLPLPPPLAMHRRRRNQLYGH